MLGYRSRKTLDWLLGKLQLVAGSAVLIAGATLKTEPTKWGSLAGFLDWSQTNAWWICVAGPLLVGASQFLRRRYCSPWAWEALQKILTEFRNEVFVEFGNDPVDHHRATLFQHKKARFTWPPLGWLVPVVRSHHLTQTGISNFRAPDKGDGCRGVAGLAWRCKDWVAIPKTGASLPAISNGSRPQEISQYAQATNVDEADIRRAMASGKPLARSFAALAVQVKGQPWGVLVLDSRNPKAIASERLERFKAFAGVLTPLLERV